MSNWMDGLLPTDYVQDRRLDQIQSASETAAYAESFARRQQGREMSEEIERHAQRVNERIDRLELVCRTLLQVLVVRNVATAEEIEALTVQLDLQDGVEDGRQGEFRADAPQCTSCGQFVNPRRVSCVYCGHTLPYTPPARGKRPPAPPKPPPKMVTCTACDAEILQRDSNFTERGLCCDFCL